MEPGNPRRAPPRMGVSSSNAAQLMFQRGENLLNLTERSSLGLLPAQALQEDSFNLGCSDFNKENVSVNDELPSRYFRPSSAVKATPPTSSVKPSPAAKFDQPEADVNWNSLLNSESFRSFQQQGSQLPNLSNVEFSFHNGAISASSTMSQTRIVDSRDVEEDFRDEGLSQGEVFGDASQNLRLMDTAEKEFQKKHAFEVPDFVPEPTADQQDLFGDKTGSVVGDTTMSRSDYFLMGTSAIGSLEKDLDKIDDQQRPNFGLGSAMRSPKRVPCRVIGAETTFEVPADPADVFKATKAKSTSSSRLMTPKEFLPSFMEVTTAEEATFLKPPFMQTNKPSPSKIPVPSGDRKPSPKTGPNSIVGKSVFKTPLPPPVCVKSKSVKPSSASGGAAAPVRHSSPVKIDRSKSLAPASSPSLVFPISSDRLSIIWLGVEIGESEKRFVKLNNGWSRGVLTNLIVRAAATGLETAAVIASQFGVGEAAALNHKENFAPGEAKVCTLVYSAPQNSEPGSWTEAKLVIKPQDLGVGKALKATVGLHACHGKPQIFADDLELGSWTGQEGALLSLGKVSNEIVKTLVFANKGTAPGFVCIKSFGDKDLKRSMDGSDSRHLITIEPAFFMLNPNDKQVVKIQLDPSMVPYSEEACHVASLAILFGPEAGRKLLAAKAANNVVNSKLMTQFSLDDLKRITSNVKVPSVTMTTNAIDDVLGYMGSGLVHLEGQKSEFHDLVVEETMSETRLNCTSDTLHPGVACAGNAAAAVGRTTPRDKTACLKMPTINEEKERCKSAPGKPVAPPPQPLNKRSTITASVTKRLPTLAHSTISIRNVHLETDKIIFPPTPAGKSATAKIKVKNPTTKNLCLQARLTPSGGPFHIQETLLEMKPKFFRSLSVTFTPTTKGKFEGQLELTSQDEMTLTAVLKGGTT